jgi:DNA-directed RNA polymerase II subunit RPB1
MNLHLPQSLQTKAELIENMMVSKNIISAQANKPVMGKINYNLSRYCARYIVRSIKNN